jgi:hypothetical protein
MNYALPFGATISRSRRKTPLAILTELYNRSKHLFVQTDYEYRHVCHPTRAATAREAAKGLTAVCLLPRT